MAACYASWTAFCDTLHQFLEYTFFSFFTIVFVFSGVKSSTFFSPSVGSFWNIGHPQRLLVFRYVLFTLGLRLTA